MHQEEAYSMVMAGYHDYPLLVIKNRVREGAKTTTFKHLNLAASIPLIACTMGRAFGDFSISKMRSVHSVVLKLYWHLNPTELT